MRYIHYYRQTRHKEISSVGGEFVFEISLFSPTPSGGEISETERMESALKIDSLNERIEELEAKLRIALFLIRTNSRETGSCTRDIDETYDDVDNLSRDLLDLKDKLDHS